MLLMNIFGLCGNTPPLYQPHAGGGGTDVSYIAEVFMDNVVEYDPGKVNTDLFFCDGASNVQKAGKVLMATFPHTFCFHGGEHVMSLFFSSIA